MEKREKNRKKQKKKIVKKIQRKFFKTSKTDIKVSDLPKIK